MFSNYQEIIKNWGLAVNSMGFTDNQVKNQMDSISRRLQTLKADLTGMVTQAGNGAHLGAMVGAIRHGVLYWHGLQHRDDSVGLELLRPEHRLHLFWA